MTGAEIVTTAFLYLAIATAILVLTLVAYIGTQVYTNKKSDIPKWASTNGKRIGWIAALVLLIVYFKHVFWLALLILWFFLTVAIVLVILFAVGFVIASPTLLFTYLVRRANVRKRKESGKPVYPYRERDIFDSDILQTVFLGGIFMAAMPLTAVLADPAIRWVFNLFQLTTHS